MEPDLAFSALTLTVGHKKDIQSIKYSVSLMPRGSLLEQVKEDLRGTG